ncbi:exodeoxyribonuclease VII small subunit [Thermosynechococcaceae cyanobacterium BACA0444]|uniref:Exodeoxyribonuclease VII small subunit n=1 Tax=Pseudocalidococcus azoricus BACA0444 TaxID=2918990 RepID=A0AAE4FWW3_9CYAN|nr:exodeoxyribonuclease VII small subunit [Pseudocalidococcus azoricus]MDS3862461.1 exodeoxyribonuclease VII small subunit [Pseudocalidococcus azoricus BACA0444]
MTVSPPPLEPEDELAWDYPTAVARVEETIREIEAGQLDLGTVLAKFATAVRDIKQCESWLSQHRQAIDLLIEELDDPAW